VKNLERRALCKLYLMRVVLFVNMSILKKWKTHIFFIICVTTAVIFFLYSLSFLSVNYRKEKNISLELCVYPKYDLTVNLTLEIPRVNVSAEIVQTTYYTITKRPHSGLKQIVSVSFHLVCNRSNFLHIVVNELEPIEGWSCEHNIYYDIVHNATNSWIIKEYFSSFVVVYTVKTSWLSGLSEIPIFRDAYHYAEGFKKENHYTTERIPFLISTLSVNLSLLVFGLTLIPIPAFRKYAFRYYPWLTISIVCVSVLVFILWTSARARWKEL